MNFENEKSSHKGTPVRLSADFSTETLVSQERLGYLKSAQIKNLPSKNIYLAKLSFR